jgi:hypothetical protein
MDDVLFTFIGNEAGISPLDITAIDVIGWNLLVANAPEPGVLSLFIFGSLALVTFSRRRRPSGSGGVFAFAAIFKICDDQRCAAKSSLEARGLHRS